MKVRIYQLDGQVIDVRDVDDVVTSVDTAAGHLACCTTRRVLVLVLDKIVAFVTTPDPTT